MARLPLAEPILEAAALWRDRCLVNDGSVLSEENLWTRANLQALDKYFVQNLDVGEGDFFSKLEAQLHDASPEVKRLAAEMLWVMYLVVWQRAMGAETKRYQVRMVWGWSGQELPEGHPLLGDILAQGVSHPGTAYNTHRWREFLFFITMMEDWKALDPARREALLNDPWGYASWLESREHAAGRQLRHVLLYLLFPDHFERMATASHKEKIVRVFRKKWNENPNDIDYSDRIALDQELLRIRERLLETWDGDPKELDFYRDPLANEWRDKSP